MRVIAAVLALALTSPAAAQPFRALFRDFRYEGRDAANARPVPPGHYRNPILAGFRPDPSIVRVGRDFYLITSSFSYWPGLPIFHSRDLVSWTQIGAAVDRREQMAFDGLFPSLGLYGPDIKHHRGRFYALSTCMQCGGNFVVTATKPGGSWSQPYWLPFEGIDPAIFFDSDGRAYIVNNGPPVGAPRWPGHRALWLQEFDLASMTMTGPRTVIVDGGADPATKPEWIEGPHLFKRGGFYHLIAAEGGTGMGHSQVAFRSRTITGPYAPAPINPILTQRDLNANASGAIAAAGHADFVELADGSWWAVFLGVRPYNGVDYNSGRDTFLLPVAWRDGWPVILPAGMRVPRVAPRPPLPRQRASEMPTSGDFSITDMFRDARLATHWAFLRTPRERWWATGGGKLIVTAGADALGELGQPSFLALRQAHENAEVIVRVDLDGAAAGDRAGLAAFMDERRWFALVLAATATGRQVRLERRRDPAEPRVGIPIAAANLGRDCGPVWLRISARGSGYGFSYRLRGGVWQALGGTQDGTILSTAKAGGFTGVMLGPYAAKGSNQVLSKTVRSQGFGSGCTGHTN